METEPLPRGLLLSFIICFLISQQYKIMQFLSANSGYLSAVASGSSSYMMYPFCGGEEIERRPTNHSIAFLTVTGHRPGNGTFYFGMTLRALQEANVPDSAMLVNNYSGENNTELYSYLDRTNHSYVPEIITRPSQPLRPPFEFKAVGWSKSMLDTAAGDSAQRKKWRISQSLDFLYVMKEGLRIFPETDWFVFLEDDAVCTRKNELIPTLLNYMNTGKGKGVSLIRLNKGHGMVAQMFHRSMLTDFVGYSTFRFHLVPIDWLLILYLEQMGLKYERQPILHLFQHKGELSSFADNEVRKVDKRIR